MRCVEHSALLATLCAQAANEVGERGDEHATRQKQRTEKHETDVREGHVPKKCVLRAQLAASDLGEMTIWVAAYPCLARCPCCPGVARRSRVSGYPADGKMQFPLAAGQIVRLASPKEDSN